MMLSLPALPVGIERNIPVQTHPGHVDSQQLFPDSVALRRRQIRLLEYSVLEMIYHGTIRNERQRIGQVGVVELTGIRTEEALRPFPGKEFHGHGMYLARLQRRPHRCQRHTVSVHPCRKSMSCLVGHHLHVMLRSVEVCEDKRHLVIGNAGAEAAACLAFRRKNIQQLPVQHHAEELAGLRTQFVIELPALRQNIVRRPYRSRIAGTECQCVICKAHRVFLTKTLRLLLIDLRRHRHQIFHHGRTELLHVFLRIAVAHHPVVTKLHITIVAQLASHLIPQMHKLVIQTVKIRLMILVPLSLRLPCGQTACVIRIGLKRRDL